MQVTLDDANKEAVLELLAKLKAASGGGDKHEQEKTRMQRAKEKSDILADEFKAEAAARTGSGVGSGSSTAKPAGTSVRVTLLAADKPSDRKLVVLPRADAAAGRSGTVTVQIQARALAGGDCCGVGHRSRRLPARQSYGVAPQRAPRALSLGEG